jgi:hypothetical protein
MVMDHDSDPPAPRRLENSDLLRIEQLSAQGLSHDVIATLMGMSPSEFWALSETDLRIGASLTYGRCRGIEAVSNALFRAAASGADTGAGRFYLERLGPSEFRPPRIAGPQVVIHNGPIGHVDMDKMEQRFARQRALVDGTADDLKEG